MAKRQTALIIKAQTKYTIVDENGEVRGTSPSYISAIDIARDLGFGDNEEVTLEQCLQHIYSSGGSLRGLGSENGTEEDVQDMKTDE